MDFNRIGKLIRQTKDKLIVATDTDLLVVMDLDSYEELIRDSQAKNQFVAKDALKASTNVNVTEKADSITLPSVDDETMIPLAKKIRGPVSVKDVIADRAEQTFVPSTPGVGQVDEEDEFYFEEVE